MVHTKSFDLSVDVSIKFGVLPMHFTGVLVSGFISRNALSPNDPQDFDMNWGIDFDHDELSKQVREQYPQFGTVFQRDQFMDLIQEEVERMIDTGEVALG